MASSNSQQQQQQQEQNRASLLPLQVVPVVVRDPRFMAGRATVGQSASIDVFGTLLQEAVSKYGEADVEAAPVYYEYGNALFRHAQRQKLREQQQQAGLPATTSAEEGTSGIAISSQSSVAKTLECRQAAEERLAKATVDADLKPAFVDKVNANLPEEKHAEVVNSAVDTDENNNDDDDDDVKFALEMMETAWSILDNVQQSSDTVKVKQYSEWINDQVPRVLTGIGDVLSALNRHADSADAYLRALGHRQEALEAALRNGNSEQQQGGNKKGSQLLLLQCHRKAVEANILIVEELLACGNDSDVVTSESNVVLVTAGSVIDYARGYYDKARDELQEAVVLLGQLAASHVDIGDEKENICFVATMVMGAGTALVEFDELAEQGKEPAKKKAKA
jgi:hypothetical protein